MEKPVATIFQGLRKVLACGAKQVAKDKKLKCFVVGLSKTLSGSYLAALQQ